MSQETVSAKDAAAMWRCGVSTGVEVTDRVLALMRKSRSKAVLAFVEVLDEEMQRVMDARHQGYPMASYGDAFDAHKRINTAAQSRLSAQVAGK